MQKNQVACPKCNHTLNRWNPHSIYFFCPNCQKFVKLHEPSFNNTSASTPTTLCKWLSLGDTFTTEKGTYTLTGKIVKYEGKDKAAQWVEYCFVNEQNENLFLAEFHGHWNLIEEVEPFAFLKKQADTYILNPNIKRVNIEGSTFHLWHDYYIKISCVEGEFNFNPYDDANNIAFEYIYKDELAIVEVASANKASACYKGQYYFPSQIRKGLGKSVELPYQRGLGANQPFASGWNVGVFRMLSAAALGIMLLVAFLLSAFSPPIPIARYENVGSYVNINQDSKVFISPSFTLPYRYNLMNVRLYCGSLSNDWVGAEMTLVNNQTNETRYFAIETEYYFGYEEGTHWSEGGIANNGVVENLPKGNYHLEIQQIQNTGVSTKDIIIELRAYQGSWYLFTCFAVCLVLLNLIIWMAEDYFNYEKSGVSVITWVPESEQSS